MGKHEATFSVEILQNTFSSFTQKILFSYLAYKILSSHFISTVSKKLNVSNILTLFFILFILIIIVSRLHEYQVIGRRLPTESVPEPKLYRMRIFASNDVIAKSRYWYFLQKLHKVKKASGEIVALNRISEAHPTKVKNFGMWIRYESRSGVHNMYKEYRDVSRVGAVETMYQDLAARHRARFRSIHILKVVELAKTEDVKRQYIRQFLTADLKFPLPHRVQKSANLYSPKRPTTYY